MFANYPSQPTQQEMDHLYKTHMVKHRILSKIIHIDHTCNNRTSFYDYDVEELMRCKHPVAALLEGAEQRNRAEVFSLEPTRLIEVKEINVDVLMREMVDPLNVHIEDRFKMYPVVGGTIEYRETQKGPISGNPCFIINELAICELPISIFDRDSDLLFGHPVFVVKGGERAEIMLFSGSSIQYSNMIPKSYFDEAIFGGANLLKLGPYALEIFRRIRPLKVNTQVVLHSNLGLLPKDGALIWKMVATS